MERVVRNLLREAQAGTSNLPPVQQVITHQGKFFPVSPHHQSELRSLAQMQSNAVDNASKAYQVIAKQVCDLIPGNTIRKWMLPQPGHLGIFKLHYRKREQELIAEIASTAPAVEPRPHDVFVLPDAYWVHRLSESVWPAAASARDNGAFVASLIYDLIPLTHPEFVGEKRSQTFSRYLTQAIENSDQLLAISQTVAGQLTDFCHEMGVEPGIQSFQLGAEICEETGPPRDSIAKLYEESRTPYLMVATFDPRKNHAYVLDAFDRLWNAGVDVELCLVGRIGSRCNEVVQRVMKHQELNRRLFIFDDLSDSELTYCYRRSRGVIFPSYVEGYGLPIVEALWHGKRTFASDTPIHREVGADSCEYFDLDDPSHLQGQICQWESELKTSDSPDAMLNGHRAETVIDWQTSWEQLIGCLTSSSIERQAA